MRNIWTKNQEPFYQMRGVEFILNNIFQYDKI